MFQSQDEEYLLGKPKPRKPIMLDEFSGIKEKYVKQTDDRLMKLNVKQREALTNSKRFQLQTQSQIKFTATQSKCDSQENYRELVLRYGNYKMKITAIYQNFSQQQEKIKYDLKLAYFGLFPFQPFGMDGTPHIMMKIPIVKQEGFILRHFKMYFLYSVAGIIERGYLIYPFFGYDILVTERNLYFMIIGEITQNFKFSIQKWQKSKKQLEAFAALQLLRIFFDKIQKDQTKFNQIVKKICELTKFDLKNTLEAEKLRQTIIYFYNIFKKSDESVPLVLLRTLFIFIEDWDYVLKTQNKTIAYIESPFMKLLKSTEFLLFRLELNQGFEDENDYIGLIDMCEKIEPTEDFERKLISFVKQIASARRMYDCEYKWKTERISQLEIARKHFRALEQQEAIHHILHTFIDLCGHQPHDFKVDPPGCVGLKLYSRHFTAAESQLHEWKDYEKCKVARFMPVEVEFAWMFQNPASEGRDKFISTWSSILKKQPLKVFVARLLKIKAASSQEVPYIILQLEKIALKNQSPKEIREKLLTVNGCLDFVILNEKQAQKEEERITEEQKANITRELSRILSLLDKASPKSDYFKLYLMIVQFKFDLFFGKTDELETQLATIVAVFESKLQHPSCLLLLFSAYELMRRKGHGNKVSYLVRAANSYESKRRQVFSRVQQFSRKFAQLMKMGEGEAEWQQVDKLVKNLLDNRLLGTQETEKEKLHPKGKKVHCTIEYFTILRA